jgi:hypothetical protein
MGYLRASFVVLAVLGAIAGVAVPAVAATTVGPAAVGTPAPASSSGATGTITSTPASAPAPAPLSETPVVTQQPDGSWVTTIYVNSSAVSPGPPAFALVTSNPDAAIGGKPSTSGPCANPSTSTAPGLTRFCLVFTPGPGQLPAVPVSAAVVMTPAASGAPVEYSVAVHRLVSAWQYLWIPLICGFALGGLLIAGMFALGLADPNRPSDNEGRPKKLRGAQLWNRPIYAGSAWSFSGSWATNVTTAATLAGAVLAATGSISELLPGVETGRFSLLIALAGAITLAAPLLFGALNYRFERVDPTSTGAAMITLPVGRVAVLHGSLSTWLWERLRREYRYGGTAVTVADQDDLLQPEEDKAARRGAEARMGNDRRFAARSGALVTRPDGITTTLPRAYRAVAVNQGDKEARPRCEISVPAGATLTIYGAAVIPALPPVPKTATDAAKAVAGTAQAQAQAPTELSVPDFRPEGTDFSELPPEPRAIVHSGATLTVPSGGCITVEPMVPASEGNPPKPSAEQPSAEQPSAEQPSAEQPCLSMPGTCDIVLSAGLAVTVDPWVVLDAKDTHLAAGAAGGDHGKSLGHKARAGWRRAGKDPAPAGDSPVTYWVPATRTIELAGNAKISVLGVASLGLPAGSVIASPRPGPRGVRGTSSQSPSRTSSVTAWTVFPLPHSGEAVASRMWSLLLASFLTLFGAGATTGILGVLAFGLSTASLLVRSLCVAVLAVSALIVWSYSITSMMALADPTPGDAISTAGSSSFLL